MLRQVVERAPDFADGWGSLSLGYAWSYWGRGGRYDANVADRARAAIRRARQLDPDNGYAAVAENLLVPMLGNWASKERAVRAALARRPHNEPLLDALGWVLAQVGRWSEAAPLLLESVAREPLWPGSRYPRAIALWGANRLEEAEAAFREDTELFPTYFASWFGRVDFLIQAGRLGEALAIVEDRAGRPPGIPTDEFEQTAAFIRAMESRRPDAIDAVMRQAIEKAHHATGYAEIAIKYASMLGRLDDAFAVAGALFFGRGFDPGELRYSAEQAIYSPRRDRRTHFLFLPNTGAMRADPRFERLVTEIGLTRYWQETGTRPDYQRA